MKTDAIHRLIRVATTVLAVSAAAATASEGGGADVGTGWNVLTIPASAFTPDDSGTISSLLGTG
jgi:hypothetical protein